MEPEDHVVFKKSWLLYVGLIVMTLGYCWWAWLALGISSTLFPPGMEKELPLVTRIAANFSAVWLWQTLAGISLVANFAWGMARSKNMSLWEAHSFPLICHMGWISGSFFWNAVGTLSPFLILAYAIVPNN